MKKILLILSLGLFLNAHATNFDFNSTGNQNSNEILKNFISSIHDKTQVVSYFYDINNDNSDEVIGIVKSGYFYSLEGYKLFVLKKTEEAWSPIKSDIYFDNTKNIEIKNKKITFYKTVFYKNKKCKAKIKKDKITTSKSLFDCFKNKKAHDIEEITKLSENHIHNDFEIENFHAEKQKAVDFHYTNLNDKTKHYLELK